jgi:hypothetical protein
VSAETVAALPAAVAAPGDWPWWGGPTGDNHAAGPAAPTEWSETRNVLWKTPVPSGHATPVVVGDSIFLAVADESAGEQSVLAIDRETGATRWRATAHAGGLMEKHPSNTHASGTPAWDGERLIVPFLNSGAAWLTAFDRTGRRQWQSNLGPHNLPTGGGGPSALLYGSLAILPSDSENAGFVAAVHRATGDLVWRRKRSGEKTSYGNPVLAHLGGRPQLILHGAKQTVAYDPDTGNPIWTCAGPSQAVGNGPTVGGGMVFAAGGYPEKAVLAIRADGSGDVTKTHVAWRITRGAAVPYVPTMLWYDDHLYAVTEEGIAYCFDARTGTVCWQERLHGSFYSSPVLSGGHIYAASREGVVHVFAATPTEYEEIAKNKLPEGMSATPVICGGKIFLRTSGHLYCIANPATK